MGIRPLHRSLLRTAVSNRLSPTSNQRSPLSSLAFLGDFSFVHGSSFVCLKVGTGTVNERIFFPILESVGVEPWQQRVTVTDCGYQIENWKTLPDGPGFRVSQPRPARLHWNPGSRSAPQPDS